LSRFLRNGPFKRFKEPFSIQLYFRYTEVQLLQQSGAIVEEASLFFFNSHEKKISGTKKINAKTNATFIFKKNGSA